MKATIITIGDEILVGQTVDTNSTYIAKSLNLKGIQIYEIISISDTRSHIISSLDAALKTSDLIIITGGLGPTNDDITKKVLVDYFDDELIVYPQILEKIKQLFIRFNKPFLDVNELQAHLPKNATIIENDLGTASGMWFTKNKAHIISLPGVPFEMKGLLDKFLIQLTEKVKVGDFYHNSLLFAGIGETYFAKELEAWEKKNRDLDIGVAYLPSIGSLKLRLTGKLDQKDIIDSHLKEIIPIFPKNYVGNDESSLEKIIGDLLISKQAMLGTVESCTGGGIANRIISIPGASTYFEGSIVSYSNELKNNLVGVDKEILFKEGAVSEAVVIEMANNGLKKLNVDYCLSISGVAGPDGGTIDKPVGTVWMALANSKQTISKKFSFGLDRERNIEASIIAALNFIRINLLEINMEK